MRALLVLALVIAVTGYGPPRPSSSSNGCGGGGGGCGGGGQVSLPVQAAPCSGNNCGGGGGSFISVVNNPGGGNPGGSTGNPGGSGDYWWAGNNSPFSGPPAQHVTVTGSSPGKPHPVKPVTHQQSSPFVQRPYPQPQQSFVQPTPIQSISFQQAPPSQNVVQPPMGICPATYVCVHWQLCRNGYVITDGSGNIDKRIKDIPTQVASRFESCGGDMVCCAVPAGSRPGVPGFPAAQPQPQPRPPVISQPQILAPAPSPPRPAIQPPVISAPASLLPVLVSQPPRPSKPKPAPQLDFQPAPQPAFLPAPQPAFLPAPQPAFLPAPQPAFLPAPQPSFQPAPQPAFLPAPQPAFQPALQSAPQVVFQPAPQPARPSSGYGRPSPQNPLIPQRPQPIPQPTNLRPIPPQPQVPLSNPIGLVSPPSPQPMGMMGMMMGMPMRGGSCSAGTYCVQPDQCNPYNGFIIRDPSQLMAVWPDAPTVPLLPCFVPDGSVQNGVCCQEAHPNAGGFD